MFLPAVAPAFDNELSAGELDTLRRNLEFPDYGDGRWDDGRAFFESALSDGLVICPANGVCVDKTTFIDGAFVDKSRSSAGWSESYAAENGLLISTGPLSARGASAAGRRAAERTELIESVDVALAAIPAVDAAARSVHAARRR